MSLDIGYLPESPQQRLPVWLTGPGDLYQLVHVCEFLPNLCIDVIIVLTHSVVDCGSPPTVPNASPEPSTPDTTYQGTVTYTCDTGYEVFNGFTAATATCQDNGNWRSLPTCTSMVQGLFRIVHHNYVHAVVNCGSPPTIPNGSPGTPTSTAFEGTVSYTCNSDRYHVSDPATVTCEASGSWSTRPTCSGL